MSLSSLPSALLIPPLNLVPLGLVGMAVARRWPRLGRGLVVVAFLGLVVLAMPLTSGLLLGSLEAELPPGLVVPAGADPPAAIVILGGDAANGKETGGILAGDGIGLLTLDRMRAGARLHRDTGLPILVTGGPLDDGVKPIAVQMAQTLQDEFGTPTRWIEKDSVDTWENAELSAVLLRQDGIRSVYVVTNAWHMRRALIAFAATGITVVPAPLRLDRMPHYTLDDLVPHVSSWVASYYALHEWIGCAYYWLRR